MYTRLARERPSPAGTLSVCSIDETVFDVIFQSKLNIGNDVLHGHTPSLLQEGWLRSQVATTIMIFVLSLPVDGRAHVQRRVTASNATGSNKGGHTSGERYHENTVQGYLDPTVGTAALPNRMLSGRHLKEYTAIWEIGGSIHRSCAEVRLFPI